MTLVSPAAKGIIDPRTGNPVGADDSFFTGVTTSLPTKASWSLPLTTWSPGRGPAR